MSRSTGAGNKKPYQTMSVSSFRRILRLSGLVEEETLNELSQAFNDLPDDSKDLEPLVTWLVGNGYLTDWQGQMLWCGKYKGFFMDGLRLTDCYGRDERYVHHLAVDTATDEHVCVVVDIPAGPPPKYEVLGRFPKPK